jgi:hypothetical protein
VRIFEHVDVLRQHLLAERIEQEAAFAVERAAAGGLHQAAQQARGQRRLEEHRALDGLDLA